MIGGIETAKQQVTAGGLTPLPLDEAGGFDAALEAAKRAQAKQEASDAQLQSIRDKGFRQWVGEMQLEKLKEELRKKVMSAMGLDEDSLDQLAPAIRQILEQKIQEEVERELEKQMAEKLEGKGSGPGGQAESSAGQSNGEAQTASAVPAQPQVSTGQNSADENEQGGKKCPVIPALAWPGLGPISSFF